MTKCSALNNDMSIGSNTGFGTNSSSTPKRHGNMWLTKSRFIGSLRRPCSEVLTSHEVLGTCFVGGTIYRWSGTGKGNVTRCLSPLSRVVSVAWGCPWQVRCGWSLARWVQWVVLSGGQVEVIFFISFLFMWQCFALT